MAPRRKAPRRRAKRSFNISAIELGTALSLNQKSGFSTAVQTALGGDIAGAVNNLSSRIMADKAGIISTLGAAAVAKVATKSFASGTLAKLGPLRIKL